MLSHSFVVGTVDGVLVEAAQAEELYGAQGGETLIKALLDEQVEGGVVELAVDAAEQMVEKAFGLIGGEPGFEHEAAVFVGARLELLLVAQVGGEQLVLIGAAGFQDEVQVAELVHDEMGGKRGAGLVLYGVGVYVPVFSDEYFGNIRDIGVLLQADGPGTAGG